MNVENKILLSRLMTRSGDQAWDFAVPIVLINSFPNHMRFAFLYFFIMKLGTVLLMPTVGRLIDHKSRRSSFKLGIGIQAVAVVASLAIIATLIIEWNSVLYALLLIFGIASAIGTNVMDIAVANDLVPTVVSDNRLPIFNSRLRQLDLLTEVLSPVIAGTIILLTFEGLPLFGFSLIAVWNLVSFYPEYFLLNQILNIHSALNEKNVIQPESKLGIIKKIQAGWKDFTSLKVSGVIFSYSLLWVSVLSPHGVLLTAFLKGGWTLSEPLIGTFRGLGAVFGLVATVLYPIVRKRNSLVKTARNFLIFQALLVILSLIFFLESSKTSQMLFLVFVLLSRIGLYGFSLGEMELRQRLIPEKLRGEINGVASSLNSLATLAIFGLGLIFSTPESFKYLVWISVTSVCFASLLFAFIFLKEE